MTVTPPPETTPVGVFAVPDPLRQPKVRLECEEGPRPCPWSGCRYWLKAGVCALDEAARGPLTLEEVGKHFGVTRERVRQIESLALRKLARRVPLFGFTREEES